MNAFTPLIVLLSGLVGTLLALSFAWLVLYVGFKICEWLKL